MYVILRSNISREKNQLTPYFLRSWQLSLASWFFCPFCFPFAASHLSVHLYAEIAQLKSTCLSIPVCIFFHGYWRVEPAWFEEEKVLPYTLVSPWTGCLFNVTLRVSTCKTGVLMATSWGYDYSSWTLNEIMCTNAISNPRIKVLSEIWLLLLVPAHLAQAAWIFHRNPINNHIWNKNIPHYLGFPGKLSLSIFSLLLPQWKVSTLD